MEIQIIRTPSFGDCTLGVMTIDRSFFCFTLEDLVREVPGQSVEQWKVQNQTAIPKGVYDVTITPSTRFKRDMPLLNNVPGFSGIRIHPGNTAVDTDGCILVGLVKSDKSISRSQDAFNLLFPKLQAAIMAGQRISLSIG